MSENQKRCRVCGEVKALDEFHLLRQDREWRSGKCKLCAAEYCREHYANNKEKKKENSKNYQIDNKESIRLQRKQFREDNSERIKLTKKEDYDNNKEAMQLKAKTYREDNKEEVAKRSRKRYAENREEYKKAREENKEEISTRRKSPSSSLCYIETLPEEDKARMVGGEVTVVCKNCGARFAPSVNSLTSRLSAFKNVDQGQGNFYCSDACRSSCVLYGFRIDTVDPRSKLFVEKNTKVRDCQTDHLKKLQCDEFGYNYCENCGDITDVELHHTQGVKANPKEAVTSAGHILLCVGCHIKLHAECKGGEVI